MEKKSYEAPELRTEIMSQSTWACEAVCSGTTGTLTGSNLYTNPLFAGDAACA